MLGTRGTESARDIPMFRRWIGWLLGAALIGTGSTNVVSSETLNDHGDRDIEPIGSFLVDLDKGYTDCAEILVSRNPLILRDGKVLLLQPGMTLEDLQNLLQGARPMFGKLDNDLFLERIITGRIRFGSPTRPWPSLPAGELLPEGKKPNSLVSAPCGIPPGMTRFVPAAQGPRLRTTMQRRVRPPA